MEPKKEISLWQSTTTLATPVSSPSPPTNSFWTFTKTNPNPPKLNPSPQPRLAPTPPPAPTHKLFQFKEEKVSVKEEKDWDELRQFKGEGILEEELRQDIPEKKLVKKIEEPKEEIGEYLRLHPNAGLKKNGKKQRREPIIYVPVPITPPKKTLVIRKTITRPVRQRPIRRVNPIYRTRNRKEIERLLRDEDLNKIRFKNRRQ